MTHTLCTLSIYLRCLSTYGAWHSDHNDPPLLAFTPYGHSPGMDAKLALFYANQSTLHCKMCKCIGTFKSICKYTSKSYCWTKDCNYRPLLNTLLFDNKLIAHKDRRVLAGPPAIDTDQFLRHKVTALEAKLVDLQREHERMTRDIQVTIKELAEIKKELSLK
jgi:hypothetical protein